MTKAGVFVAIAALLLLGVPLVAHHSVLAEYDTSKPIEITGKLVKVEWANPHIWFYLEVKDEKGSVATWGFSGAPPGVLMRRGISREVLKLGSVIRVQGFRARDGSTNGSGGTVTFDDGRRVFTASAEDPVPQSERK